jgi:hypothetical protein
MSRLFHTCLFLVLLVTPALAADRLNQRSRDARKACLTGDYRKGIEILADLFIATKDPIYIFNQGRCLEQSHQWQEAIDRFREYLRKSPSLNPEDTADTNKHIADCEGFLEKEKGNLTTLPLPPQPTVTPPIPEQPPQPDAPATPIITTTAEPTTSSGTGLRTAGWIMVATGVAAVATGVVLNLKANSVADKLWSRQSQSKQSQHDTLETWSWISYGAGAAFLATGATLYLWGARAGNATRTANLAVLPATGADGATLTLFGAF